jgi:hypothetical protein
MPRLSSEEIEEYLNEYSVAHIGTLMEDGSPYVVPMVFGYTGSAIITGSRARSVWYKNLVRDPRASLSIDEPGPPGRRVTVRGVQAELLFPPGHEREWLEVKRKIETKAQFSMLAPEVSRGEVTKEEAWELGAQRADYYLAATKEVPYALWSIPFEYPSNSVSTWRPTTSEGDLSGMWPARYGKITKPEAEGNVFEGWMDQPPSA